MSKTMGNLIEESLRRVPGRRHKRRIPAASSHGFFIFPSHCRNYRGKKNVLTARSELCASLLTGRWNLWFYLSFTGASRCIFITSPHVSTQARLMQTPAFWCLCICLCASRFLSSHNSHRRAGQCGPWFCCLHLTV